MAPKVDLKPAAKKGPPAAMLAKMKPQLAAKKDEEDRMQREAEEEERRLREEERLAEEQRKFEEEQRELEKERRKEEKAAKKGKKAAKKGKTGAVTVDAIDKLRNSGFILPDTEKIKQQQEEERKAAADKPKVPKPAPQPVVVVVVPEEDDDDVNDLEKEAAALEEEEKVDDKKTTAAKQVARGRQGATHEEVPVGELRSPICCVLGHVDTGKTSLLDRIRATNVQGGEAGGITQQIGATFFPKESLTQSTSELNKKYNYKLDVPGLLVIDTPGHESFSNLRSRGTSLCDIAVLVVDIMHGLERQTRESMQLLRQHKRPFIVALNKVDRLYDWVKHDNMDFQQSLELQKKYVQDEFATRFGNIRTQFYEESMNCELYYMNDNFKGCISVVPTSAHSGEGICDLLLLMIELVQRFMSGKVAFKDDLQCTVLEVKPIDGIGTTIDVVLVNGVLNKGDTIVVSGTNGPIRTQIRSLLTSQPLKELRVKGDYVHHSRIVAAMSVKIAAKDLEHAVPGTSLKVLLKGQSFEVVAKEVQSDVNTIFNSVNRTGTGVSVQSSTLGSLEALLTFLKDMKIPVSAINLGPVHKRHMHHVIAQKSADPKYGLMLAFDVPITPEAEKMANDNDVTIFSARIIYHLFDNFTKYYNEYDEMEKKKLHEIAVFPVRLKIQQVIHAKDPIILGLEVLRGNLYPGTPLGVMRHGKVVFIGKVVTIDGKGDMIGHRPRDYVVKIVNTNDASVTVGRHFLETDELISVITRPSVDAVKMFPKEMDQDTVNLLRDFVKLQGVPAPAPKPKVAPVVAEEDTAAASAEPVLSHSRSKNN